MLGATILRKFAPLHLGEFWANNWKTAEGKGIRMMLFGREGLCFRVAFWRPDSVFRITIVADPTDADLAVLLTKQFRELVDPKTTDGCRG